MELRLATLKAVCFYLLHNVSLPDNLTLRLLMSYIYIYIYVAPSKARNFNVVHIWTYVWQH